MKSRTFLLMSAAAALMAGCETIDGCDVFEPIRPSRSDVLTDGTVEQILIHNSVGEKVCKWQKKTPA